MVFCKVDSAVVKPLATELKKQGILIDNKYAVGGMIRFVTHLDLQQEDVDRIVYAIQNFLKKP